MNATTPAFHRSSRTAMSLNTDPATGQRVQTLNTSTLEMGWEAGELRIRCAATRVVLDADRARQKRAPSRGAAE